MHFTTWTFKTFVKKFFKICGWIMLTLLLLLVAMIFAIRIPAIQNRIVRKVVSVIQEKLGTPVTIARIEIKFPKSVEIQEFFAADQKKDTLLYFKTLSVGTDLWGLLHHTIQLNSTDVDGLVSHIKRSEGSTDFNFSYILKKLSDSTQTSVTDTTAEPWKFRIGDVALRNCSLKFEDGQGGTSAGVKSGLLSVSMNEFDLDSSVYNVDEITIENTSGYFVQTKHTSSAPDNSPSVSPQLFVKSLVSKNVHLSYEDRIAGEIGKAIIGNLDVEVDRFNLDHQDAAIKKIAGSKVFFSWQQMVGTNENKPQQPVAVGASAPWKIGVNSLSLSESTLQYYDFTQPAAKQGLDFYHMWISQFNADVRDIVYNGNEYDADVRQISFAEQNGFLLKKLSGIIKVNDKSAKVSNLMLATKGSNISMSGSAVYPSLENIATQYPDMDVNLSLHSARVSIQEAAYFAPNALAQLPKRVNRDGRVMLSGSVSGSVRELRFSQLKMEALQSTRLNVTGEIAGLPDFAHARFSIKVDSFHTSKADMVAVIPDSVLPASIRLPDWLAMNGSMKGTLRAPLADARITSSFGALNVKGYINLDSATYNADLALARFAVGKMIQNDSLGTASLIAHVKGRGLSGKDIDSEFSVNVSDLEYNSYHYKNFSAEGTLKKYFFTGKALYEDKYLGFDLTGDLDYRSETPAYKLKADLAHADLKALRLTARELKTRGKLDVDLNTADFRAINGSIAIHDVAIYNGKILYTVDSMLFASINTKDKTDIKLNSEIIDGSFEGTINLLSLPDVLENHFNNYFSLQDSTAIPASDAQNFKFSLTIKKTELITGILFPSLRNFEAAPVTGVFNSADKQLELHALVKRLRYDGLRARMFALDVTSNKQSLEYSLNLENFRYDSLKIPRMSLEGKVAHDSIKTKLTMYDSLDKQKYLLGAVFNSLKNEFQFRFVPGQVYLNYNEWKVPDDNYIRFDKRGMRAHDFSINHEQEKILMETQGERDSVVLIGLRQLDLANLFNIVSGANSIVRGRADGDFNLYLQKNNAFKASLKISDLEIMQKKWGELSLNADRISMDKFTLLMSAKGPQTDITLKGDYVTSKPASTLHLNADVNRLDMELLEPFTSGQVKHATGKLTGQLDISGTVAAPSIKGQINFNNVTFLSSYVNIAFTLKDEALNFTGSGISMRDFTILDDNKNSAVFNGSIQTKNYRDYQLDLRLTTKDFRVLNTSAGANDLYYGKVKMNATAKVSGPLDQPVVELKMGFSNDSEFNYIVPTTSKGVIDQKGIVEFVDSRPQKDPFLASLPPLKDSIQNVIKGMDLTATVVLNDNEKFNIIIDPRSGDKLSVQGSTTLVVRIDPSGNMTLTGQYEISKGSYNFSFYKLVRRDFELLKGGTITWSGDPLEATLNLRALYKLETSPMELMASQSPEILNQYKQSFPFLVYLTIKGDLNTPEISFMLDMPEASKSVLGGNVYAAIQDINTREQDLNKQVFSLLVLKRFMADNPFENQVTTSFSSNAKSSVSGLLTEQLNRLSQNVKGIQLNVDLKSYDDYTTGVANNQTKLQLGVSKSLLHDKLVVKLSGNVDIAGEDTNQNSLTDYIGDLALEYKVTADGRLRLTGFRSSDYDMIDGELIKTGAGLIYIKDYDTLKELFKSNAKSE